MSSKTKKPEAKVVKEEVKPTVAAQATTAVTAAAKPEAKAGESTKAAVPEKAAEEPAKKAEETKPVEGKKPGRKPGRPAGTKNAVKKPAKKTEKEVLQEVYFEYNGQQFLSNELVDRIKEEWKNEGHRIASIKSLRVYINPEERKAYYVINDKAEGKFVEF